MVFESKGVPGLGVNKNLNVNFHKMVILKDEDKIKVLLPCTTACHLIQMIQVFARVLSCLPLFAIQLLGVLAGHLYHLGKPKAKSVLLSNLKQSGLYPDQACLLRAARKNMGETGKTLLESLALWSSSQQRVLGWIREVRGQKHIDEAIAANRGIIFLTPHLGLYEITSVYYGATHPLTVLYRPPRKRAMATLMQRGRAKGLVTLAETNSAGVRRLMQALHKLEAVGLLPDQNASMGQGVSSRLLGSPAYTTTLVGKLVDKTGATVIMAAAERLPWGRGFVVHIEKLDAAQVADPHELNRALEAQIVKLPLQYLWNYDRLRHAGSE